VNNEQKLSAVAHVIIVSCYKYGRYRHRICTRIAAMHIILRVLVVFYLRVTCICVA
jgi:hypothetical protein